MRLFVVEIDEGGGDGEYVTRDAFVERLRRDHDREWAKPTRPAHMPEASYRAILKIGEEAERDHKASLRRADDELLARLDAATVGDVLEWRCGYVFVSGDDRG